MMTAEEHREKARQMRQQGADLIFGSVVHDKEAERLERRAHLTLVRPKPRRRSSSAAMSR